MKPLYCLSILIVSGLLLSLELSAQKNSPPPPPSKKTSVTTSKTVKRDYPSYLKETIELKPGSKAFKPSHFYLHSISDHTTTGDSAGMIILPVTFKQQKISFAGKKDSLLLNYFGNLVTKDTGLIPIQLDIKKMEIKEEKLRDGLVKQQLEIQIQVSAFIEGEQLPLHMFHNGGGGESYIYSKRKYDSLIMISLDELPSDIDEVAETIRMNHPAFAKGVRQKVIVRQYSKHPDSVFFNERTYLSQEDYMAVPKDDEDLYPAFTLIMESDFAGYKDGYQEITITTGAVFVRSRSWLGNRLIRSFFIQHDTYKGLLIYLYSLRLKKRILNTQFSAKNFSKELHRIYSDVQDEMFEEVRKYDKETAYGTKTKIQTEWQTRIDEAIAAMKDP